MDPFSRDVTSYFNCYIITWSWPWIFLLYISLLFLTEGDLMSSQRQEEKTSKHSRTEVASHLIQYRSWEELSVIRYFFNCPFHFNQLFSMTLYVHALACAFGLGSWVSINGLWVELPLIVNVLPEGWDLPSYLTVIIQLANLGPLLVTLAHKFCPGRLREHLVIYVVLSIGVAACVLLAVFWKNTTVILGQQFSTAFFILTFFLALVDCTSSVTFLPFMMQLPAKYITTYFIGEGLSGLVPGLVALAQGVGMSKCVNVSHVSDNLTDPGPPNFTVETQYLPPNFSTEIFFSFLAVMTAISLVSFIILNRMPRTFELSTENLVPDIDAVATVCRGLENPVDPSLKTNSPEGEEKIRNTALLSKPLHSGYQLAFIYFMVLWVNGATNGLLPSVQTFSCMPYGNMAYHLSAALSTVANPVACIIAMFFPKRYLYFTLITIESSWIYLPFH